MVNAQLLLPSRVGRTRRRTAAVALAAGAGIVLLSSVARADTLLAYPSGSNDQSAGGLPASTTATGVVGTNLLRGSGLTAASGSGSSESSIDGRTTTSTYASSVTTGAGKYYTFTVAPAANYALSFTAVTANGTASGTGPTNAQFGYSRDAFAGLGTATAITTNTAVSATLSDTNVTTATEFRFVGFRPSTAGGSAGTFRIIAPTLSGSATLRAATTLVYDGGQGGTFGGYNATAADQSSFNANYVPTASLADDLQFAGTVAPAVTNDLTGLAERSITFNAGAAAFTLAGAGLSVGGGGITSNATAPQAINLPVTLAAAQTLTATGGTLSFGSALNANGNALAVRGSGTVFAAAGIATGGARVTIGDGSTPNSGRLSAAGTIDGPITVDTGATITAGATAGAVTTLNTGQETWNTGGTYAADLAVDGSNGSDRLVMSGLTVTPNATFTINLSTAPTAPGPIVLATDTESADANPFAGTAVLAMLTLTVNGGPAPAGYTLQTRPDTDLSGGGFDLVLATVAAPEPTSLLLLGLTAAPLVLGRGRRGRDVPLPRR